MELWKKIKAWFFSASKRRRQDIHPDIRPLDVQRLALELRLRERAEELGKAGLPASDAVQLTAPELEVVQRVEKACLDYVTWANTRLSVLNDSIRSHDVTPIVNRAAEAVSEFERNSSALLTEAKTELDTLKGIAESHEAALSEFMQRHRLSRHADYPTKSKARLRIVFLAGLIAVEGVLNSSFFGAGLDRGLLGGFFAAGISAFVNLVGAYSLGRWLVPYVFHVWPVAQFFGFISAMASVAWIGAMSLTIAHFRDALVAGTEQPAHAALQSLLSTPLSLHDVSSWLLWLLSVGFGLLALADGISSDDRYPGFGKVARKAAAARADYEQELEMLREDLDELREQQLKRLETDVERAKAYLLSQQSDIEMKTATAARLTHLMDDARNCAATLLREFRDANELHRESKPRPPYFNAPLVLKAFELPAFAVQEDIASLDLQKRLVQGLIAQEQQLRADIQAAFNQSFDRLKPLGAQFVPGPTLHAA